MYQCTYASSTMSQHRGAETKTYARHYPKIVMPKVTYNSHTYNRFLQYKFLMATPTSHAYSHLVSLAVPTALVPMSTPHQCLQSFLMSQNHHVYNVLLDGNCMFWALFRQLYGSTNITFKSEACCTRDGHSHTHRSNS